MRVAIRWLAIMLATGAASPASPLCGQHVRISGVTTFQYLEVRPLETDSVPVGDALGSGILRRSDEGYLVRCISGEAFCRFRRMIAPTVTVPAIQDVSVSVWGIGEGIRAYGRVRGRTVLSGEELLWPRGEDHLDVMAAFVEVDRSAFRIRGGRQWKASGLGYYNFDGGALLVRPLRGLSLEAYGGWGLVRGVHEPLTSDDVLQFEPFAPDARPYVLGAQVNIRPHHRVALSALYQREIRDDRLGLYSERMAADVVLRVGAASMAADLNIDVGTGVLNEARMRLWLPAFKGVTLSPYFRHHRPFFELWTIWGAFSPVGYDEGGLRAAWRHSRIPIRAEFWGAGRRYSNPDAQTLFGGVRSTTWRVGGEIGLTPAPAWDLQGHYRAEVGFGAATSDVGLRLARHLRDAFVAVSIGAFQRLYELREDEGTVWLGGADAGMRLGPRTRVTGAFAAYRHRAGADAPDTDWTQLRGSIRLEWTIGTEPRRSEGSVRVP